MIDFTPVFNAIIALASALITAFFIPWIKSKVSAEKRNEFLDWVGIAVKAAEQLFDSDCAMQKKAYVINFLNSKGYKLSSGDMSNAIEAAVLELHNELYINWRDEEALDTSSIESETRVSQICEDFWRETDDDRK